MVPEDGSRSDLGVIPDRASFADDGVTDNCLTSNRRVTPDDSVLHAGARTYSTSRSDHSARTNTCSGLDDGTGAEETGAR